MRNKQMKEMIDILTTEVKINEINKSFLSCLPKRPMKAEKIRFKRIILPISLGGLLASLLMILMVVTVNNPQYYRKATPLTETKKMLTYQVVGCLTLIDDITALNNLDTSRNLLIEDEVNDYVKLVDYYLHKNDLNIESVVSEDKTYENKYLISLDKSFCFYFNEESKVLDSDIDLVSSTLEGYILINNTKLMVKGFKVVQDDRIYTTMRTYYKDTHYVEVTQNISEQENDYSFTCYKNQEVLKEVNLSILPRISTNVLAIESDNKSFDFVLQNDKIIADVNIPDLYKGEIVIYEKDGKYCYDILD